MKKVKFIEIGHCPYCNSENIDFVTSDFYDDSMGYKCVCDECKGEWEEVYSVEFIGVSADDKFYGV